MNNASRRAFFGMVAGAGAGAALGLGSTRAAAAANDAPVGGNAAGPLKILVLGGTGQTGPHFVRHALAHGHDVTLFNRGRRSKDLFPDVECLIGDRYPERGDGLTALKSAVDAGRTWDVVLDVWPYLPKLVGATAKLLRNSTARYMFVSTLSVYVDSSQPDQDETAEVGQAPNADDLEFTMELYGPFKAECENRVRKYFPGNHTIVRPGLIVGPGDRSYRGGYWPVRVRDGGEVLAPGGGETRTQSIDARDLVAFELLCMEQSTNGTFNVVGPHPNRPLTMKRLLETCRQVSKSDATFTWVPADFLGEHEVGPWMQMPCWLPSGGEYDGFGKRSVAKAVAAGLTFRPLSETLEDTLQWYDGLPDKAREAVTGRAGITAEKETEVLKAWHQHKADTGG